MLSRDLDSRFSWREVAAVEEWRQESNYSIHSMRDHPAHHAPLIGASWGTDLTRNIVTSQENIILAREAWKNAWTKMLKDKETYAVRQSFGPDQSIIARYKG